jgi:hypothetical protein
VIVVLGTESLATISLILLNQGICGRVLMVYGIVTLPLLVDSLVVTGSLDKELSVSISIV